MSEMTDTEQAREFIERRLAERRKMAPGERSDDYIKRRVGERRGSYLSPAAVEYPEDPNVP